MWMWPDHVLRKRRSESRICCPACHGDGKVPFNPGYPDPQALDYRRCGECDGTGLVEAA